MGPDQSFYIDDARFMDGPGQPGRWHQSGSVMAFVGGIRKHLELSLRAQPELEEMTMQLTTFSDYSLRILIHASLKAPELSTVGEVSHQFGISRNHVMRVVQFLGQQGFLQNLRGKSGGFTLSRSPKEISLGEVVRSTEQNLTIVPCFAGEDTKERCQIEPSCRLRGILQEALSAFLLVLDGYTLKDLLQESRGLRQLLGMSH
tara:strand:- start:64966 stop:65574 length:609 start_codon:yes stop_codon:yes gene_type:complete